jgi:xylulokinase
LHLHRAIIEGIAYDTRLNLEGVEQVLQRSIEDVRVLGGGARSRLCCQIIADVLNRTVSTMSTSEASALGAAILAAEALKLYPTLEDAARNMTRVGSTFRPIPSHGELYNRLYKMVYINCYETLRPLLKALAEVSS